MEFGDFIVYLAAKFGVDVSFILGTLKGGFLKQPLNYLGGVMADTYFSIEDSFSQLDNVLFNNLEPVLMNVNKIANLFYFPLIFSVIATVIGFKIVFSEGGK